MLRRIDARIVQLSDLHLTSRTDRTAWRTPVWPNLHTTLACIHDDPAAGVQTLLQIRDVTFGWLHEVAKKHGIGA